MPDLSSDKLTLSPWLFRFTNKSVFAYYVFLISDYSCGQCSAAALMVVVVIAVGTIIISKEGTLPDSTTIAEESKITIKQAAKLSFLAAFPLDFDT